MTARRPTGRPTGRRPGHQDTRAAILTAARVAFADLGYERTTLRHIGTSAGVDPALIHHYFGTKERLFLATVQPPVDPGEMIPEIFAAGVDAVPERLVQAFLSAWEHPVSGPALLATVRSAAGSPQSARLVRDFFIGQVLRRLLQRLSARIDPAELPLRASLVASQLFGLAVTRYVLKLEPLASAPHPTVVAAIAPTVRRYLIGQLG